MSGNIVAVLCWHDDERTQPADYVVEFFPGLYQARVYDEAPPDYERVLGVFVNPAAARTAIYHHEQRWWRDLGF